MCNYRSSCGLSGEELLLACAEPGWASRHRSSRPGIPYRASQNRGRPPSPNTSEDRVLGARFRADARRRRWNGRVVELDDWEFDIELSGPVKRILRSGAAAYVLADSIDELATKIAARPHNEAGEPDPTAVHELTSSATVDDLIAAFLRESVEYSTRILIGDGPQRLGLAALPDPGRVRGPRGVANIGHPAWADLWRMDGWLPVIPSVEVLRLVPCDGSSTPQRVADC